MYVCDGLVAIFPSLWLVILCVLSHVYSQVGFSEVDKTQYEAGRAQLELLQSRSQLPQYGKCWTNTLSSMQEGCAHLTDVMQSRLALAYLNCFLLVQGRDTYFCDDSMSTRECLLDITESDRSSLATFFTHTQNICYFLQSQVWHKNTQATITRLSQVSDEVAENLAATTDLQREALRNQEVIMQQSVNLSRIINMSSENLHQMISDFRKTTDEQRLLINDIFDKIGNLQKTMLGEFSGFYSIVYYTLSILLSYLVTSTPRTSGARFWMFGIVTLNIMVERFVIYLYTSGCMGVSDTEEAAYGWHSFCRKVSAGLALIILVIHAVRYRDLTALNNELLRDIKAELFHLRGKWTNSHLPGDEVDHLPFRPEDQALTPAAHQTTSSIDQLHTLVTERGMGDNDSDSSDSAWSSSSDTSGSGASSDAGSSRIEEEELEFLRNATPLRDEKLWEIQNWSQTGFYTRDSGNGCSVVSPPSPGSSMSRYNMRPRSHTQLTNPALREESPRTFRHQVKNLERLAMENSLAMRESLRRMFTNSSYSIEKRN
ncbi:uncharacterized protein LOC111109533 [Crassostrea virginica]